MQPEEYKETFKKKKPKMKMMMMKKHQNVG